MHMIMYHYIHTYLQTFSLERANANQRHMFSRTNYALPVYTTLLRRWNYVNAVPTTLALRQSGSYYVVTMYHVL